MSAIEESIQVHAPLRAVYDQWTQFEEFPKFMQGIVEKLGNAFGVPDRRVKGDLARFKELGAGKSCGPTPPKRSSATPPGWSG
jgi:hypothetical protein